MVLRERRQGAQRPREHGRAERPFQRQSVEREDQGLGARPRRLAAVASGAAAEVGLAWEGPGSHERKRDGLTHTQHLYHHVQVGTQFHSFQFNRRNWLDRSNTLHKICCKFSMCC